MTFYIKDITGSILKLNLSGCQYITEKMNSGKVQLGRCFLQSQKKIEEQYYLDDTYMGIDTPAQMQEVDSGFRLLPHQKISAAAILEIADRRMLELEDENFSSQITTNKNIKIVTSALSYGDPFGSGKTFVIIAVLCLRPRPRVLPEIANSIILMSDGRREFNRRRTIIKHSVRNELKIRYDIVIRPSVIITGSAVLLQWEDAIKSVTKMKIFTIAGYFDLVKLEKMIEDDTINAFDVILLKNGTVTGEFDLPSDGEYRSIVNVFTSMLRGRCVPWAVYDDFDNSKTPPGSRQIPALFSVYVSATSRIGPIIRTDDKSYDTLLDLIKDKQAAQLNSILNDRLLFKNFKVEGEKTFVENSAKITKVEQFVYTYDNPDNNYMELLGAMGEDEAKEIVEMLNSDAVATAASKLGIVATSISKIFEEMLNKKYTVFLNASDVLKTAEEFDQKVLPALEYFPEEYKQPVGLVDQIRTQIQNKVLPKPDYKSEQIEDLAKEIIEEAKIDKDQSSIAINRVKDNVREGDCQICRLPLKSDNEDDNLGAIINKCCGIIVCEDCGFKGNDIKLQYDYKTQAKVFRGSCANCKKNINPQKDIIFLERNFDIDSILTAKGDEGSEPVVEEAPVVVEPEAGPSIKNIKNPKLKALVQICKGITPDNQKRVDVKIAHLMEGRIDIPQKDDTPKKVAVFSNHTETLVLIENIAKEFGIEYFRLQGTAKMKHETAERFKTERTLLIINSSTDCAGLNVQWMTHLVLYHKITDPNIEAQVGGRGQRIGREVNLHIHHLCYKNEEKML